MSDTKKQALEKALSHLRNYAESIRPGDASASLSFRYGAYVANGIPFEYTERVSQNEDWCAACRHDMLDKRKEPCASCTTTIPSNYEEAP